MPRPFDSGMPLRQGASSVADLLSREDEDFVRCAYFTLLGRAPDPQGQGEYLERLRSGASKLAIARELRASPEGAARRVALPGMQELGGAGGLGAGGREATITSMAQLLALHDRAFVLAGYRVVLRREPDDSGLQSYLRRLRAGEAKVGLLEELRTCGEAAVLAATLAQWRAGAQRPDTASPARACAAPGRDALFAMPARDFVSTACAILQGCAPDAQAGSRYVAMAHERGLREQVLAQLWASPEAARAEAMLAELDRAIGERRLARMPVVGWILGKWKGIEGDSETERRLRRIENQLARLVEHLPATGDESRQDVDEPLSADEEPGASANSVAVPAQGGTGSGVTPLRSPARLLRTFPAESVRKHP